MALTGGAPVKVTDAVSGIAGAAWGPDDTIVFAWFDLFRAPAAGGSPSLLLKVDEQRGERFYRHPTFLPSGKGVLFTIGMADTYSYDDAQIGVLSLESRQKTILIEGGSSARYSPSGHLIYAREGKLLAVPFDADRLQVTGEPFPVADGVFMSANTGMAAYAISSDGHLVYAPGPIEQGTRVPVWVDRQGKPTPLPLPPRSYLHPRLSPDGRQVAIEVEGASHDIFTYDIARGALTKMSFDGASHWPTFTPDGRNLTFRSWRTGTMTMWSMPADRSGPPTLLTDVGSMQSPESWLPDGTALAFTQMDDPASGSDIYVLPLGGDRKPFPVVRTKFSEGSPKFSPDGHWLAYSSNESGRSEVYVMAYPGPGPKITGFEQWRHRSDVAPRWEGTLLPERQSDDGGCRQHRSHLHRVKTPGAVGRPVSGGSRLLVRHGGPDLGQLRRHRRRRAIPHDRRQSPERRVQAPARRLKLVHETQEYKRARGRHPSAHVARRRSELSHHHPTETGQVGDNIL